MTLVPLSDCCFLLGVDPKTLRLWLKSAHLSCTEHPGDARLKCLRPEQVHQLAHLHGRVLPDPLPGPTASPEHARLSETMPSLPESELRQQLVQLQTQVSALQQQVTDLALVLLREHAAYTAPCTVPLPTSSSQPPDPTLCCSATSASPASQQPPTSIASNSRARSHATRVHPLVEYGVDGQYVIIDPAQGVLSIVPDTPAWFDWIASVVSFHFRGQSGRLSVNRRYRSGRRIQSWNGRRVLNGRSCTLYMGLTKHLTIALLEQTAATAQERLTNS